MTMTANIATAIARFPPCKDWIKTSRCRNLGTFSKVLFPALRIGYLVLPLNLVALFARAKWLHNRQLPTLK